MTRSMDRRRFLGILGATTAAGALAACTATTPRPAGTASAAPTAAAAATAAATARGSAASAPVDAKLIRLSSVVIPQESGLYAHLLPDFEKRSGLRVEISTGNTPYKVAREGKADIVLSHYQHDELLPFMQEALGEFPRTVFASPGALIGPAADPAGIRGASDLVDAFARLAKANATFVVNDQDGLRYVAEVARRAADVPLTDRYVDKGTRGGDAMRAAMQAGGYTLWGLIPFLRMKKQQPQLGLEALFTRDQLLKSGMVTVVARAEAVPGANVAGARELQRFLAEPATQAKIRTFRMEGHPEQVWWPAAHDNESSFAKP
jgi:tungstate transport system substrate-binding protein